MSKPTAYRHNPGFDYATYLESPEWARLRRRAIVRAGGRCQLCNSRKSLNVHHRTYTRIGEERLDDLTVLCRSCHERFHGVGPEGPREPKPKPPKRVKGPKGPMRVLDFECPVCGVAPKRNCREVDGAGRKAHVERRRLASGREVPLAESMAAMKARNASV